MCAADSETYDAEDAAPAGQAATASFGLRMVLVEPRTSPWHMPPALSGALGVAVGFAIALHHGEWTASTLPPAAMTGVACGLFGWLAGRLLNRTVQRREARRRRQRRERRADLLRTALGPAVARLAGAHGAEDQEQAARALGTLRLLQGDAIGAMRDLKQASSEQQPDGPLYNNAGVALALQDRLDDAYRAFKRSRRMEPRGPWSDLNLCLVKLHQDEPRRALRYLQLAEDAAGETRWNLLRAVLEDRAGQRRAAIARLRSPRLETRPDPYAANALAVLLAQSDRAAEAATQIEHIIEWHPWFSAARNNRGLLSLMANRLRSALRDLRTAAAQAPDDATISGNLGIVEHLLGNEHEALAALRHAAFREPQGFESHYNLSQLYLNRGRTDEALAAAEHAVRIKPDGVEAHLIRAAALFQMGAYDSVIRELQPLTKQHGVPSTVWHNLALAQAVSGHFEEALSSCQEAIRLAPNAPAHRQALAYTYHVNDHMGDAYRSLHEALAIERSAWVCYHLGVTEYAMKRYESAADWLAEALSKEPTFHQSYFPLGCAFATMNRAGQALTCWEKGLASAPASPELLSNVGLAYYRKKRTNEAIDVLRRAFFVRPDDPVFANNLALAYAQAGRFEQAADFFAKCVDLRPRSVIARCNLGLAYYMQGQVERALEEWTRASHVDPGYFQRRQRQELQNTFDDVELRALDVDWHMRAVPVPVMTAGFLPRFLTPVPALQWQVCLTEDMPVNVESLPDRQDERLAVVRV